MKNSTVGSLLKEASAKLKKTGVRDAEVEAEILLSSVLSVERGHLALSQRAPVSSAAQDHFFTFLEKRCGRVPAAYILGQTEFMGIPFLIDERVLIPRPETELLVETALGLLRRGEPPSLFGEPPAPSRPSGPTACAGRRLVADIGTGSGCIAIALACFEPEVRIVATDIDSRALEVAHLNASRRGILNNITWREGDLFEALKDLEGLKFDLVVSNLPYVSQREWPSLAPEVREEPRRALDGGEEGLTILRRFVKSAPAHLVEGGWVVLEMGQGQSSAVRNALTKAGFGKTVILKDFGEIERVVAARYG